MENALTRLVIANILSQPTVTTDMILTALKEVPRFMQGYIKLRYDPTHKALIISEIRRNKN